SITASGVSSGAFLAVQLHVAYSKTISGIGSIAGGVYYCSEGDSSKSTSDCMRTPQRLEPKRYLEFARRQVEEGRIDPLPYLRNDRVYLFAGAEDRILNPIATDKLHEFYSALVSPAQIVVRKDVGAGHGFPTEDVGSLCRFGGLPWLLRCDFDAAGEILKAMYGNLKAPVEMVPESLIAYDQAEFGADQASLYSQGFMYVPNRCAKGAPCRLHVALHGCQMNPDYIGSDFVARAGYNGWAEANDIVVLYPQVRKSPGNPYGCWDWWGYTGEDYAVQSGPQMKAIKDMIDRVAAIRMPLRRLQRRY
ncbi:MAG: PHB depolymerase family esterase, partial [Bdellovibrionaceae bacterium]|nr:PHB depolymerase family esterase [Pseudobdellovibrionaceae bacterium]